MLLRNNTSSKLIKCSRAIVLAIILLFTSSQPVWAAGPPEPSPFSNPLAIMLLIIIIILLIVIAVLANILIGAADIKVKKRKKENEQKNQIPLAVAILTGCLLISNLLFAQTTPAATETTSPAAQSIGGLSASAFYIIITVIFLELLTILALLINIRILLKVEKEKVAAELKPAAERKPRISWWNRFNKFKPVEQEADIDLGHDYDGIRELDNRLPPWWLYGFYITIIFAAVYLWRSQVSHTAPSSKEEYEMSVQRAELKVSEYLKQKGESVDENSVQYLADQADLDAGKALFIDPSKCALCHRPDAGGNIGPNLTDDYWLNGGDIKSIFRTIKYGVDGKGMASWQTNFSPKQIAQIASYIKSLKGTNPPNPKEPQGQPYKEDNSPAKPVTDSLATKENKVVMN
ncbi:MAG: cbb3-type cytochrome c oxidase N-terminal domain-containing protein, partial [Chitinophagaceae bacterium]